MSFVAPKKACKYCKSRAHTYDTCPKLLCMFCGVQGRHQTHQCPHASAEEKEAAKQRQRVLKEEHDARDRARGEALKVERDARKAAQTEMQREWKDQAAIPAAPRSNGGWPFNCHRSQGPFLFTASVFHWEGREFHPSLLIDSSGANDSKPALADHLRALPPTMRDDGSPTHVLGLLYYGTVHNRAHRLTPCDIQIGLSETLKKCRDLEKKGQDPVEPRFAGLNRGLKEEAGLCLAEDCKIHQSLDTFQRPDGSDYHQFHVAAKDLRPNQDPDCPSSRLKDSKNKVRCLIYGSKDDLVTHVVQARGTFCENADLDERKGQWFIGGFAIIKLDGLVEQLSRQLPVGAGDDRRTILSAGDDTDEGDDDDADESLDDGYDDDADESLGDGDDDDADESCGDGYDDSEETHDESDDNAFQRELRAMLGERTVESPDEAFALMDRINADRRARVNGFGRGLQQDLLTLIRHPAIGLMHGDSDDDDDSEETHGESDDMARDDRQLRRVRARNAEWDSRPPSQIQEDLGPDSDEGGTEADDDLEYYPTGESSDPTEYVRHYQRAHQGRRCNQQWTTCNTPSRKEK